MKFGVEELTVVNFSGFTQWVSKLWGRNDHSGETTCTSDPSGKIGLSLSLLYWHGIWDPTDVNITKFRNINAPQRCTLARFLRNFENFGAIP